MPAEPSADEALLDDVLAALARSSAAALDTSHELLAHYTDTGDGPSQRAVNTLIDHAADALRSLTDSLDDISGQIQANPPASTTVNRAGMRYGPANRSSTRRRPRRER